VWSYSQFCPIARGAEVLGARWTMLIVRNLLLGCGGFNEIHAGLPGISRTLLAQRLRQLEQQGIVQRVPAEEGAGHRYQLTPAGEDLHSVCHALGVWGSRWLELQPVHYDSGMVLWALARKIPVEALPPRRAVIRFDVADGERPCYWLLVQRPRPEVCVKASGFGVDLVVSTTSEWLAKWFTGRIALGQAIREQLIEVEGPRSLERLLASWGGLGTLAPYEAPPVPASAAAGRQPAGVSEPDRFRARPV
jgi:DNA-binding HxlR family transcriptional regulator